MAAPKSRAEAYGLAIVLLAIFVTRHWGWDFFPDDLKGLASKGLGGLALLAMVWVVYSLSPSRPALGVVLFASVMELQVAICSFAFMRWPWPLMPGQPMCSAKVEFDLGSVGIVAVVWILVHIIRSSHAAASRH